MELFSIELTIEINRGRKIVQSYSSIVKILLDMHAYNSLRNIQILNFVILQDACMGDNDTNSKMV